MAILSYFGILVLVPLLGAKQSKFAQYHAKQGVNLCIVWIGVCILDFLLGFIKTTRTEYLYGIPYEYSSTPWFISLITWLLSVAVAVLAVIGIVNVVKGRAKELPIIGKFNILK